MKKIIKISITFLALSSAVLGYAGASNLQLPNSISTTKQSTKVNLNKADAATIVACGIKGIGLKRAQAIVTYRNLHGEFKSFEELAKVKGIGASFIKTNLDKLTEVFVLS